ncbi:hypothetical protein BKA67DRAFT_523248 [Truncatella angustata]|uniref:Uncharacterized protein n=1 Tax=Truncatella angustata TaxID=152316 RepID=A0A9P8ZU98_9PEZI|nr:uncharacterized protein BKA67DRAFT_523248 [Truncatella angustata]KAH6648168.1 hypothetical protein BKA67DRAFT_523248 [Truncatella angustata]KAH8201407.1 hypothetical protein TruAng_004407 [Truncatella angustata]
MARVLQTASKALVVKAPAAVSHSHKNLKSVFLAGPTSGSYDWRGAVIEQLRDEAINIFNPHRPDWDSSWREDLTCAPYVEQVRWELEKQEEASVVAVYFGTGTDAPISLLELGLCAKEKRAVVFVEEGYSKKGNVQLVCERYGVELVGNMTGFRDGIIKLLRSRPRVSFG